MLLAKLLNVVDDFDRALAAMPPELEHLGWIEGLWLVERKLRALLESEGVTPIEGETLAPNVSPYGTAHFSRNGHVVTVTFTNGPTFKGIISGTWVQEKDPDNIEVTHDYLNKDYDTKPMFQQAHDLAILQVKHEFSRLGALIKGQYGDAGVNNQRNQEQEAAHQHHREGDEPVP